MTERPPGPFTRVTFSDAAKQDVAEVAKRSRPAVVKVFAALKKLDAGEIKPIPLQDFGKTGDLTDCGKIVVEVPGEPEYRIVVRSTARGFEVYEVIAVEERTGDLPYLLAGIRLDRLSDPVRRTDAIRRIARIRQARAQRP